MNGAELIGEFVETIPLHVFSRLAASGHWDDSWLFAVSPVEDDQWVVKVYRRRTYGS